MRPNLSAFCPQCGKLGQPMARTVPFCSSRCRILAAYQGVYLSEDGARFDSKCERDGDCLIFRGDLNHAGYGTFYLGRYSVRAHRFAWTRAHGPIPEGFEVEHTCHRRDCVEDLHLRLASHGRNMRRSVLDGRMARGNRVANAKLSEAQVIEIRSRYRPGVRGAGCGALALEYGVSQSAVHSIVTRRTWSHVKQSA